MNKEITTFGDNEIKNTNLTTVKIQLLWGM